MKVARTVWSGGKDGDDIKVLPITIADVDSDTILMIPNKILREKAKECEELYPTPINMVEGQSQPKMNNMKELRDLDSILSNNYIGKIVNMSQIANSYMNDAIRRGEPEHVVDELYQASSRLSSLSQIEIDKSKKVFDNVNMSQELRKIRDIESIVFVEGEDRFEQKVDKMVVPEFFSMISDSNEYRVFEPFLTPLDILQDVLVFKRGRKTTNIEFRDLLVAPTSLKPRYPNLKQIETIYNIVNICGKKINGLMIDTCTLNDEAKATVRRKEKDRAIGELKRLKIQTATVLNILRRCFKDIEDEYGFSRHAMLCLNLLLESKRVDVLECFRNKSMPESKILIEEQENIKYDLFGKTYQEVAIKDLKSSHLL